MKLRIRIKTLKTQLKTCFFDVLLDCQYSTSKATTSNKVISTKFTAPAENWPTSDLKAASSCFLNFSLFSSNRRLKESQSLWRLEILKRRGRTHYRVHSPIYKKLSHCLYCGWGLKEGEKSSFLLHHPLNICWRVLAFSYSYTPQECLSTSTGTSVQHRFFKHGTVSASGLYSHQLRDLHQLQHLYCC